MPRLTLVSPEWAIEEAYGGEVSVRLLRDGLVGRGWKVQVLTGRTDAEGSDVIETSLSPWSIYKHAGSFNADLIHAYNNEAIQATLLAARAHQIPCLATANSYWATCLWADMTFPSGELCQGCSMDGLSRDYANRDPATIGKRVPTPLGRMEVARRTAVLKAFDAIVALSDASRAQLAKGGVPASDIDVVPNMVDPRDSEAKLPELAPNPQMLFVGQLSHVKGVTTLIEALPRVVDEVPEAALKIAGRGPREERIRERTIELGLGEHVELLGHVPPERLREVYRSSRALAMPSIWVEPFGRVILEAWSHGAVVVAGDRGGPGDVIDHESTGLLTQPGNPQTMAEQLIRALDDDEMASQVRSNAKDRLSVYEPARVVDAYEDVYQRVAGEATEAT